MPNSKLSFADYVVQFYQNDPYSIMDKFSVQISEIAERLSIDWFNTRRNISLENYLNRKKNVKGLTPNDEGRVSILGCTNKIDWEHDGKTRELFIPCLQFRNFRVGFENESWNAFSDLYAEYEKYLETGVKPKPLKPIRPSYNIEAEKKKEYELQLQAIEADKQWLKKLKVRSTPCPYFNIQKNVDIGKYIKLYQGYTSGKIKGSFTAYILVDIKSYTFRGIQRVYPSLGVKRFRRGLNQNGACVPVPSRRLIDGEPVYIMESVADAGKSFELTGVQCVAAINADNLPNVASLVREVCPNSPIILVADNDQYPSRLGVTENKGVTVCETAARNISPPLFILIPTFENKEKELKYKDVSDYAKAYGIEKCRNFLNSWQQ